MKHRSHRFWLPLIAAVAVLVIGASPAVAATSDTTPETQSHSHGVYSSWTINWGGPAPIDVRFDTDYYMVEHDTVYLYLDVSPGNAFKQAKWYPCNDSTFTQKLRVIDVNDMTASDWTTAFEDGGSPC